MLDILSIGSAVRDFFILSKELEIIKTARFDTGLAECLPLGSKIDVDELVITTGGGGTNTATTFAELGLKTGILAKISADDNGQTIKKSLAESGINTDLLTVDKSDSTGLSIILTAPGGERTVLVYRGVSGKFKAKDFDFNQIKTNWIYLSSIGGDVSTLNKIAKHCEKEKIQLAWNPGAKELAQGKTKLKNILQVASVIILNKEEAITLIGHKPEHVNISGLLQSLQQFPEQIVIITDSARGTYALQGSKSWHIATSGVKSRSRAGAGDAFGSGTIAALIKGHDLKTALRIGTANAESVIKHVGAKKGILKKIPGKIQLAKYKITKI